jgi:hypothetical protein
MSDTTNTIRILKKAQCGKISSPSELSLTYNIGYHDKSKSLYFRVITNTTGGFFSNEWISLDQILTSIKDSPSDKPFKAIIFKPLYESKGSNNHGFLAAALRAEKLLLPVEKQPMSHITGELKDFDTAMQKLIKSKTNLEDEVAAAEVIKAAQLAERVAKMQKANKNSKAVKSVKATIKAAMGK